MATPRNAALRDTIGLPHQSTGAARVRRSMSGARPLIILLALVIAAIIWLRNVG